MSRLLNDFADMARESKTEEGDWQGDGWGVSWLENSSWDVVKSTNPIWEEKDRFLKVPKVDFIVAHARSASFDKQKGEIEYNEPYIEGKYSFVFNGFLRGVSLGRKIPGKIGAQKIWFLLREELQEKDPEEALSSVTDLLVEKSRSVKGLNIGLSDGENIYAVSKKHSNGDYFTLKKFENDSFSMICSEEFGDFDFVGLEEGEIIAL